MDSTYVGNVSLLFSVPRVLNEESKYRKRVYVNQIDNPSVGLSIKKLIFLLNSRILPR
jgi:hypothetical protein